MMKHSPAGIVVFFLILFFLFSPTRSSGYEGFGGATPGGDGKPVYHVTTLSDAGPGSLRDGVSQGGRVIVFDVDAGFAFAQIPLPYQAGNGIAFRCLFGDDRTA